MNEKALAKALARLVAGVEREFNVKLDVVENRTNKLIEHVPEAVGEVNTRLKEVHSATTSSFEEVWAELQKQKEHDNDILNAVENHAVLRDQSETETRVKIGDVKDELSRLEKSIEQRKAEFESEVQQSIEAVVGKVASFQLDLNGTTDTIGSIQSALDDLDDSSSKGIGAISNSLESVELRVDTVESSIKAIESLPIGVDGQDRPLVEPVTLSEGRGYKKNTVGRWGGTLWIATRETNDCPSLDPHSWSVVVDGINDLRVKMTEDKSAYEFVMRMGSGDEYSVALDTPHFKYKGIHEEDKFYEEGDFVTLRSCLYIALEPTKGNPPGNGWKQMLVAPRGRKGEPGEPGAPGKDAIVPKDLIESLESLYKKWSTFEPKEGKPGRNGRSLSAREKAALRDELLEVATKRFEDDREAAYAITSFRGNFYDLEDYRVGDVVQYDAGLYLCIRSGRYDDVRGNPNWELIVSIPKTVTRPFAWWQGEWEQRQYQQGMMVRDGQWLMIANKDTTDRAGPIESGQPTYGLPDVPVWDTDGENTSVVYTGHYYTFTNSGWFKSLRVMVPEVTATTNYRFIVVRNPDTNPISTIFEEPVLEANTWVSLALANVVVTAGEKLLVLIDALNSSSATPTSGGWSYVGQDQNNPPGVMSWNHNNAETILRIDKTDLDSNDRGTELMGITANSAVRFSDSTEPSIFREYRVQADPVDQGDYVQYSVTLVNSNGILGTGATDMDSSTPIPQSTKYKQIETYWGPGNLPAWGGVEGFKQYDGVDQPGVEDTAFGIDLSFVEGSVSPDWDMMATSNSSPGSNI